MENASKALVIAGAILVSILVISLGIFIYNSASSTVKKAGNVQGQEAMANNQPFIDNYGENKTKTDVDQLLSLIAVYNRNATTKGTSSTISVAFYENGAQKGATSKMATIRTEIEPSKRYTIQDFNDDVTQKDDSATTDSSFSAIQESEAGYYSNGFLRVIKIIEQSNE